MTFDKRSYKLIYSVDITHYVPRDHLFEKEKKAMKSCYEPRVFKLDLKVK